MPRRKESHIEVIIIRAILQHLTFNNDAIHLAAILSKGPTVCITTNAFSPCDIYPSVYLILASIFICEYAYKLDLVRWMKRVKRL